VASPNVERCVPGFRVPNQHLDHADIRLLFEQVCRETVAQGMHEYALGDARGLGGGMLRDSTVTY
jgi:hypothetical protein